MLFSGDGGRSPGHVRYSSHAGGVQLGRPPEGLTAGGVRKVFSFEPRDPAVVSRVGTRNLRGIGRQRFAASVEPCSWGRAVGFDGTVGVVVDGCGFKPVWRS